MASEDYVIKRNGTKEKFSFNKILNRLDKLGNNELQINYTAFEENYIGCIIILQH